MQTSTNHLSRSIEMYVTEAAPVKPDHLLERLRNARLSMARLRTLYNEERARIFWGQEGFVNTLYSLAPPELVDYLKRKDVALNLMEFGMMKDDFFHIPGLARGDLHRYLVLLEDNWKGIVDVQFHVRMSQSEGGSSSNWLELRLI